MTTKPARAPVFVVVPAGTRCSRCRGPNCTATIYWVRDPSTGRVSPIDCDVEGGKRPSDTKDFGQLDMLTGGEAEVFDGRGVSHFANCVDADRFRQ
jgi:hypothetical protein